MRILGFSKKWSKLQQDEFTTFRYPRKDSDKGRDWHLNEIVKIVYHPRQEGEVLGVAQIIDKSSTWVSTITEEQAIADGFPGGLEEMLSWLTNAHKNKINYEATRINKLTIHWIERTNLEDINKESDL